MANETLRRYRLFGAASNRRDAGALAEIVVVRHNIYLGVA